MNASAVDAASSVLHNGSLVTPRQILGSAEHLLMVPSSSLLNVHAPAPGQSPQSQVPPPAPPSTPNGMLGVGHGGSPGNVSAAGSNGTGQGHITMAFAQALAQGAEALAQGAAERGVDTATLVQLLQSPTLVIDVLLSKAGDLQLQQQQQQHQVRTRPCFLDQSDDVSLFQTRRLLLLIDCCEYEPPKTDRLFDSYACHSLSEHFCI